MSEKYYLMPGCAIGKKGLPDGKLECKKGSKPLALKDAHAEILEKNIPYLMSKGTIKTASDLETAEEKAENGKSEKRLAMEAEAAELDVEFNDRTTGKDLQAAIDEAKKELED